MQVRIEQSGNDVILVIPRAVAQAAHLKPGTSVEASIREGKLVIGSASRPKYTLEELLAGITEENRHEEIATGPAIGRETW